VQWPKVLEYSDADGTLLFLKGPQLLGAITGHRFFSERFIAKMV